MRQSKWLIAVLLAAWSGSAASEDKPTPPLATKVEPKSGLEFVRLPGGKFHFGCEPQDEDCAYDEKPGKLVKVQPFWLARIDVTVAAYTKCVTAGACTEPSPGNSCNWGVDGKDDHPINCIVWSQAAAFCQWIGGRLPTVEEWEYAAKGGESRIYPWGDDPPDRNRACFRDTCGGTAPANSYGAGASKHGLLNMAGNVWQWTASTSEEGSTEREVRGGSWVVVAENLRASDRHSFDVTYKSYNVGMRCAL